MQINKVHYKLIFIIFPIYKTAAWLEIIFFIIIHVNYLDYISGPQSIIEKYYPARGFNLQKGIYEFDLIGLERKEKGERESKNYGYAFVFRENSNTQNHNFEKADNDVYKFDIQSFNK